MASLFNWGSWKRSSSSKKTNRFRPMVTSLEGRDVPAGPTTIAYAAAAGDNRPAGAKQVKVYQPNGSLAIEFDAYSNWNGAVRVACGDVNKDGVLDVVTVPGPGGGPVVRVFDGVALQNGTVASLRDFFCFPSGFVGGSYVAVGDLNRDGYDDIITGVGGGAPPLVNAFSGQGYAQMLSFYAFPQNPDGSWFTGGVRLAASDVGGDNGGVPGGLGGSAEIVCGAGAGGGPLVTVYQYVGTYDTPSRFMAFYAYDPTFRGGVYVGAGRFTNNSDVDGYIYSDIVTGPGEGGGPLMRIWSTDDAATYPDNWQLVIAREVMVYNPRLRSGLRVAGLSNLVVTGQGPASNGLQTIMTSAGSGSPTQPGLILFTTNAPEPPQPSDVGAVGVFSSFTTYDPTFQGGVFVGGN